MGAAAAESDHGGRLQVGQVHAVRPGEDDNKTLRAIKFQVIHCAQGAHGLGSRRSSRSRWFGGCSGAVIACCRCNPLAKSPCLALQTGDYLSVAVL